MQRIRIEPRQQFDLKEISGGSPAHNAKLITELARGEASGAMIEVVAMNAGLALLAAGKDTTY